MTNITNPLDDLAAIEADARAALEAATTTDALHAVQADALGKRSPLSRLHSRLGPLPPTSGASPVPRSTRPEPGSPSWPLDAAKSSPPPTATGDMPTTDSI